MITTTILKRSSNAPPRRSLGEVLGKDRGASSFGSTYYKSLLRCPREHALNHVARMAPTGAKEALDVGILVHKGLETLYRALWSSQTKVEQPDPDDQGFLFDGWREGEKQAFEGIAPLMNEPGYEETYPVVERMLGGYFDFYRLRDRWRIVAVEETLEFTDSFEYSARLDMLVEDYDRTGLWIVEHKSARSITPELREGYQLDLQILGQVWLMHQCVDLDQYPPLKGVLINIVTKHKSPQFERVEVMPSNDHLRMFERSINHWSDLREVYSKKNWPQALGACSGIARGYTRCPYFDVCHNFPRLGVADWMSHIDAPSGFVFREDEKR